MKTKTTKGKKLNILLFILSLILITAVMFVYIGKKDGFHEDEIYSYGSSNYKYGDIFYSSGDRDATNRIVDRYIVADTIGETIENYNYYKKNPDELKSLIDKEIDVEKPIWKTPEEAKDYLTVSEDEIFNYISPYYNQTRDVHPPLFYFLVHLTSSFFAGTFTKYIIFSLNLVFFLLTCLILRKILILYNRDSLVVPAILLYGLSMGAISMVIFLRMYAMVTFFTVAYFYLTLKIVKNDFSVNRKTAILITLTTVAGFLTQYYFCIFAVTAFVIVAVMMLKMKKFKNILHYTLCHIIAAASGILLFPKAIDHIFNSSRGIGSTSHLVFSEQLEAMVNRLTYAFSLNRYVAVAIFLIIISYIFIRLISRVDTPEQKKTRLFNIALFTIPAVVFILMSAKLSPNLDIATMVRYITPILPIVAVSFVVFVDMLVHTLGFGNIIKTLTVYAVVAVLLVCGFITNKPSYLYDGYDKYTQIAEENKDLNFVYVYDNYFTHLNSLPEMMIYNKTLILNYYNDKQMYVLNEDAEFKKGEPFVLSIKKWMENPDEVLAKVLELSGYTDAELLHDGNDDTQGILYLVSK